MAGRVSRCEARTRFERLMRSRRRETDPVAALKLIHRYRPLTRLHTVDAGNRARSTDPRPRRSPHARAGGRPLREVLLPGNPPPFQKSSVRYGPTRVGKSAHMAQVVCNLAAGSAFPSESPLLPAAVPCSSTPSRTTGTFGREAHLDCLVCRARCARSERDPRGAGFIPRRTTEDQQTTPEQQEP
jgi:hypothetical protein